MRGAAQIAHVELATPTLDQSLAFFCEVLGMQISQERDGCAFLRAYEERYHHSLKLTAAEDPGLLHIGVRLSHDELLEATVAGLDGEWIDGDCGHGAAYRVVAPTGHVFELFHDVDHFEASPEQRSIVLNRAQRRPEHGVPVRRLDHVNVFAGEIRPLREWLEQHLPFELREQAVAADGTELGAWLSSSSLMHDIAAVKDPSGHPGRLHHVGFWYGAPQHLWDAADLLLERGMSVEHGPGKHGVTQSMYLYVFEPGGNRIELFGDVGQLVFDPTWVPVTWIDDGTSTTRSTWIGGQPPATFHTYGTPAVPGHPVPDLGVRAETGWIR